MRGKEKSLLEPNNHVVVGTHSTNEKKNGDALPMLPQKATFRGAHTLHVPTIFFNNIYIIQKTKLPLVNLLIKKKLI
jgi:hypothetical protein